MLPVLQRLGDPYGFYFQKPRIETEGLLTFNSHVHCKRGNVVETVQAIRYYYRPLVGNDIWLIE